MELLKNMCILSSRYFVVSNNLVILISKIFEIFKNFTISRTLGFQIAKIKSRKSTNYWK